MSKKEAMNAFVKLITKGDDDLKKQVTAARARRMWKNLSTDVSENGRLLYVVLDGQRFEAIWHPILNELFVASKKAKK